MISHFMTLRST